MIEGIVNVSTCAWCHKQGQVVVKALGDDEDASFARIKMLSRRSDSFGST
jgi:hypothetical protein